MDGSSPPKEWRVPRNDWDQPPWNRWSFQNVRKILPTENVSRGNGPITPLEENHQAIGGISFKNADGEQTSVDQMLDDTYTDGFLICHMGKVVHESYYNGMKASSQHLAQSVSKSVTSTVTGIMIGRGLMDPQAPITTYLPELEQTAWKDAKLQHVLDMASGVKFSEEYTDPLSDIGKTDVASGWREPPPSVDTSDWPTCIWDQILGLKETDAAHGARFYYRSIETDVIAHAMQRVTAKSLAQLVSDEIWSKIGAEHNAYFTVDSAGYCLADGGFNATLRDFARFGQLYIDPNQNIIPQPWIDDCRRGNHGLFNDEMRETFPKGRYRNQFWIDDYDTETIMCLGVFGQLIYIMPSHDIVAVKLSTFPDFIDGKKELDAIAAIKAIALELN
jgi:CubicO group peptidase (beta-lactamase class C family)